MLKIKWEIILYPINALIRHRWRNVGRLSESVNNIQGFSSILYRVKNISYDLQNKGNNKSSVQNKKETTLARVIAMNEWFITFDSLIPFSRGELRQFSFHSQYSTTFLAYTKDIHSQITWVRPVTHTVDFSALKSGEKRVNLA